ncbi:MAG: response regulator, partial [SAR324 cluster bacterium]|nr:response regulator [SAR324 cluster bacterium]
MELKGTVLIADDNAESCRLAGVILEAAGFRVFLVKNGQECLELAREHLPDAIVLDRMMPGLSGDAVAEILKKDQDLKNIKIIMLSAKDSADDRVVGLNLGADDYLTKPYNRRELSARVTALVRTKKAEAALQEAYSQVERKVQERTADLSESNT